MKDLPGELKRLLREAPCVLFSCENDQKKAVYRLNIPPKTPTSIRGYQFFCSYPPRLPTNNRGERENTYYFYIITLLKNNPSFWATKVHSLA